MKRVTAEFSLGEGHTLHAEPGQFGLHRGGGGNHARQFTAVVVPVGEGIQQVEHASTLGNQGFPCLMVAAHAIEHAVVVCQCVEK